MSAPANFPMDPHAILTPSFGLLLASPIELPAEWMIYIGLGIAAGFGAGLIALGLRFAIDARRDRLTPDED